MAKCREISHPGDFAEPFLLQFSKAIYSARCSWLANTTVCSKQKFDHDDQSMYALEETHMEPENDKVVEENVLPIPKVHFQVPC